ncbi:hypothetical protein KUW19_00770 [Ferrimonas balearica]|uniref:hypothetical protein n=1 Tax=Ferrimonas balearica TaxID=44012 RepID=UPI001C9551EA|nr:hypothetical protein [Ferrimonas balearica]MBY6105009.1 hypothetical protein [Ferrimonas balearica]
MTNNFTTISHGLLLAGVLWMAKATSEGQIAYARIEERLAAQHVIIMDLQRTISAGANAAVEERRELSKRLREHELRIVHLEKELANGYGAQTR